MLKSSSSDRIVCPRRSDPAQPMHHLSRDYRGLMSKCSVCYTDNVNDRYHLHCQTCKFDIHRKCLFKPRCSISDFTNPHILKKRYGDFSSCYACGDSSLHGDGRSYYHCDTCKLDFHKGCHLYPPEITHPFHPSHPLRLTFSSDFSYLDVSEPSDSETETDDVSKERCKCCRRVLREVHYHCSKCNFSLNPSCTRNPPPPNLLNLKSHEHTLTVFPRRVHAPCDACGLSLNNIRDLVYACLPCNYMVHMTCIYLPRVIKITSHSHRLSFSSALPSGNYDCRVCHRAIDVTCGQFSCTRGCHYAIHSKCAVEERVWNGKDLEGEDEEYDGEDRKMLNHIR